MWMLKRMQNPQNDRILMISFLIMHLRGGPVGEKLLSIFESDRALR